MKIRSLLLAICCVFPNGGILHAQSAAEALRKYAASLKEKFSAVPTITTQELASLNPAPVLLDVREENEFAVSHLPGAHRATADPVAQLRELGASTDALIVVYCSVGYRSSLLAEKLQKSGFTNVRNLEGSIFAWANEGRPLVNTQGTASGVHPFNILWGRYLDKSKWQWKRDKGDR